MEIDEVTFYTDLTVVLGYILNESRIFYVYVANYIQLIRKISSPEQWTYFGTSENPADLATYPLNAQNLVNCSKVPKNNVKFTKGEAGENTIK